VVQLIIGDGSSWHIFTVVDVGKKESDVEYNPDVFRSGVERGILTHYGHQEALRSTAGTNPP